jgi:hypothetical protein
VSLGHVLENVPCVDEVESILLQCVLRDVVAPHLNVVLADRNEKLGFNVGSDNVSSRTHPAAQPVSDGAGAGANFNASPTLPTPTLSR